MADPASLTGEVAAAAARYRLRLGTVRYRGRIGSRRGVGVGSSMEFLDFRDYVPGDDLRHVDWRGYARTNQLRIRLHQEEVAPHVDVLLDTSASMASTPVKERSVRGLAIALGRWTQREGAVARTLALGAGAVDASSTPFAANVAAPALPVVPLRPNGVRILLTDGLWAGDPSPMLQRALAGASQFACVQILDPWEIAPDVADALTLVDVETGERAQVRLDARTIARYRERLDRATEALRAAVLVQGGAFVRVTAGDLGTVCARDLLPAGIVEPA